MKVKIMQGDGSVAETEDVQLVTIYSDNKKELFSFLRKKDGETIGACQYGREE